MATHPRYFQIRTQRHYSYYTYSPHHNWHSHIARRREADRNGWQVSDSALYVAASVDALNARGIDIANRVTTSGRAIREQVRKSSAAVQQTMRDEGSLTREQMGAQHGQVMEGLDRLDSGLNCIDNTLFEGFDTLDRGIQRVADGVDRANDTLELGFAKLVTATGENTTAVRALDATFQWGVAEVSLKLNDLDRSLGELIGLTENPERTWAFEQFDYARDAFRKGLHQEAFTFIDRAINGYQMHTGFMLESRFHDVMGLVRLGGTSNDDNSVIDIGLAEKGFLQATRYSIKDNPVAAATSMGHAAWAAHRQGEMTRARDHLATSRNIADAGPEIDFMSAKLAFHINDVTRGISALKKAIEANELYVIKWITDGDCMRHAPAIEAC